jgi:TnpA family transposase
VNRKRITGQWDEILRLATSIKHGSVTASLMLRELGAYPRQNGLVVAAIVLWKTVYLERAVTALRQTGQIVPDETLTHLSPLMWEHINLTGDYHWRKDAGLRYSKLRPLRASKPAPIS